LEDIALDALQERLGYRFANRVLLTEALTHPSFAAENHPPISHNQRLEFLGDAVLQLVITDVLYRRYPSLDEGDLTRIRSALTNEEALVQMAAIVTLADWVRLGKGEQMAGGQSRSSTLADTFEAVLGALFLDGGLDAASHFLSRVLGAVAPEPLSLLRHENPKGRLQELTQERFDTVPIYTVLKVTGPDHLPEFEVSVAIAGTEYATARARSRKLAEKEAARQALQKLMADAPGGLGMAPASVT